MDMQDVQHDARRRRHQEKVESRWSLDTILRLLRPDISRWTGAKLPDVKIVLDEHQLIHRAAFRARDIRIGELLAHAFRHVEATIFLMGLDAGQARQADEVLERRRLRLRRHFLVEKRASIKWFR